MTPSLDWHPATRPPADVLDGRFVRLEPLDPARHGDDLWSALQGPSSDPALWAYLPYGPFADRDLFDHWLRGNATSRDPLFYAVVALDTGQVQGQLSLMSIVPEQGRIEIGHVAFGAAMQRTPKGTEAVYLLARQAFALGNRRLEWKCNAENDRSQRAAQRFGFTFEGVFRQHMVVKGQNRDTAWYSVIDREWPALAQAFEAWLSEENQLPDGQRNSLEDCRAARVQGLAGHAP
ncbi:GNAT family N-acetyltransferase [Pseudomonas entomophila]|uniref:GNAT family N-acetyltransferase n=1 Tax=Pseudomonas entomophila TaxID=312306 RepID=UPI0015E2D9D6|nr:GNAT family protein [Pseudomonas entomophila]MBA1189169.1 GNAT family N-acetyltransferase [Pseudomonas entomophila]